MAAVTIHSDFGDQEEEICDYFQLSPSICHAVMGLDAMIFFFFKYLVLSQLFHSASSPSSGGSLVPLCFLLLQ